MAKLFKPKIPVMKRKEVPTTKKKSRKDRSGSSSRTRYISEKKS